MPRPYRAADFYVGNNGSAPRVIGDAAPYWVFLNVLSNIVRRFSSSLSTGRPVSWM